MYYKRNIDEELLQWSKEEVRKPLLLRGARQVGKTSAVRHLGEQFEFFVEIDLNERKELHQLFAGRLTPQEICNQLALLTDTPILAGRTLLFIDEIQACPDAINRLRYFYEKYPELHLIAAGSLLEFTLKELPSFGVGRIRSLFMYPFSFGEYLQAQGMDALDEAIRQASSANPLPDLVHQKAIGLLRTFLIIGGMPEVIAKFVATKDLRACQQVLDELITSYMDDFSKYSAQVSPTLLRATLTSIARQTQGKFVYSQVDKEMRTEHIKKALQTLILAGLVYPVVHTAANGIPLGAEINEKYQRMILLDTGLLQRLSGLDFSNILLGDDIKVVNQGGIAEVFVGNELVKATSNHRPAQLYCWHREDRNANAEVDYVVQRGATILPIEVKSGVKGSMHSLRMFLDIKQLGKGVRTSLEGFSTYGQIEVCPLYAISTLLQE